MMTQTPARLMGLDNKGVLRRGMDADIIIFDEDVTLKSAIVGGKTRF
jgi:N-acetylglucosamine-6-phosphate deacetylase